LQELLFFVFVVAVAFGTWFLGYGLSLLRANLETQVPDAPRDDPQGKRPRAAGAMRVERLTDLSTTAITAVTKPGTRLDEPREA
jgi:hypothetical protein